MTFIVVCVCEREMAGRVQRHCIHRYSVFVFLIWGLSFESLSLSFIFQSLTLFFLCFLKSYSEGIFKWKNMSYKAAVIAALRWCHRNLRDRAWRVRYASLLGMPYKDVLSGPWTVHMVFTVISWAVLIHVTVKRQLHALWHHLPMKSANPKKLNTPVTERRNKLVSIRRLWRFYLVKGWKLS